MAEALLEEFQRDFTQCPVCFDTYRTPKLLPCGHTFCLPCLEQYAGAQAGGAGDICCPMCRIPIPSSPAELRSLPTHFFISRLIEMKLLSGQVKKNELSSCDSCCHNESSSCVAEEEAAGGQLAKQAIMFCMDCREKLCEECVNVHKKVKVTRGHTLVSMVETSSGELQELLMKQPITCGNHAEEKLTFYCLDCSQMICMKCGMLGHKEHSYRDIDDVARKYRESLDNYVDKFGQDLTVIEQDSTALSDMETAFEEFCSELEQQIEDRANTLHEYVDCVKENFLQQLRDHTDSKSVNIDELKESNKQKKAALEDFLEFARQLKMNGTNFDIAGHCSQLVPRARALEGIAEELSDNLEFDLELKIGTTDAHIQHRLASIFGKLVQPSKQKAPMKKSEDLSSNKHSTGIDETTLEKKLSSADITYEEQSLAEGMEEDKNESEKTETKSHFIVTHAETLCVANSASLKKNSAVIKGMAILMDHLFVVRVGSKNVEIYKVNKCLSGGPEKEYTMKGVTSPMDIVAHMDSRQLIISEFVTKAIIVLAVEGQQAQSVTLTNVRKFNIDARPSGLSMACNGNLLICCSEENMILEYSLEGNRVRQLSTYNHKPQHVIEVYPNQYFLAAGDNQGNSLILKFKVNFAEKIVLTRQLGGDKANIKHRPNEPKQLMFWKRLKRVFMVDSKNNRVVALLLVNLFHSGPHINTNQGTMLNPQRICSDEAGEVIYVGCQSGEIHRFLITEIAAQPSIAKPMLGSYVPNQAGDVRRASQGGSRHQQRGRGGGYRGRGRGGRARGQSPARGGRFSSSAESLPNLMSLNVSSMKI